MANINEAINFVQQLVIDPALIHPQLEDEHKNVVKHSRTLLRQFRQIGDLYLYLSRFSGDRRANKVSARHTELGLKNFEDIHVEFGERFIAEKYECTNLDDFIIGEDYTSWDIAIFSRTYNVQKGIYLIGPEVEYRAIFVKATMGGEGKYANEWIIPGQEIKYYFKSVGGRFSDTYKDNRAILDSGVTPIYLFEKSGTTLTLSGIFRYASHEAESDGSMWFRLVKRDAFDHQKPTRTEELFVDLDQKIRSAFSDSPESRRTRLRGAPRIPKTITTTTITYQRNPDVIVEALDRANGICERCSCEAPFIRRSDGTRYLEVHHKVRLADGGEDTIENALALCPNCHRELHYGLRS